MCGVGVTRPGRFRRTKGIDMRLFEWSKNFLLGRSHVTPVRGCISTHNDLCCSTDQGIRLSLSVSFTSIE